MKKFTLLMIALLLSVMGVNAKTVTTITTLTIADNGIISSDQFASASESDVITFSHATSAGTHFKLFYKIGGSDNWAYHKFTGVTYNSDGADDYYTPWINYENTYKITITSDDLEKMKDYGIWLEDYAGITNVTLAHSETEDATNTTSIWTGSHNLGNYSGLNLTGDTYKNILKNAKIGDILRATYTSNEAGYINFCNGSGWTTLIDGSFSVATTNVAKTVEYEIVSATVLEAIQQNGIAVNGTNASLSAVDLLTYESSYDAVSITVGSDGIATYSNGNKNVQISACDDLKAYYASAVATGTVTLTELTGCIPASTGVMIYGEEGTYTVPVGGEGWPSIATNYLKPSNGGTTVTASTDGSYHYIFAKKGDDASSVGFYKLTQDHTLDAHKAYLETTDDITPTNNAPLMLDFGDGTTAIMDVFQDEMKQQQAQEDNVYYTLQGTRVQNPTKGLYILNGKKIIVK